MPPFIKITSVADTLSKVQKVIKNLKDWTEGDGAIDLNKVVATASRFPNNFFVDEQRYVLLSDVIHTITTEMDLVSMDMGEVPELVARALLLDSHKLTPLIVEKAFPAGVQLELYNLRAQAWAGTLMKTQDNGMRSFKDMAMKLASYYITTDDSFVLIAIQTKRDISIWFPKKLTRAGIVYLLVFFRDIINFLLIIQATNGNTDNGTLNGANDIWQNKYGTDVQKIATRVLHMLRLKCIEMLTSTWFYMIDNDVDIKAFPVSRGLCTAAVDAFKASRISWDESRVLFTPVRNWPVFATPRYRKMRLTINGANRIDVIVFPVRMP